MPGSSEIVLKKRKKLLQLWRKLPLFTVSSKGLIWKYHHPWSLPQPSLLYITLSDCTFCSLSALFLILMKEIILKKKSWEFSLLFMHTCTHIIVIIMRQWVHWKYGWQKGWRERGAYARLSESICTCILGYRPKAHKWVPTSISNFTFSKFECPHLPLFFGKSLSYPIVTHMCG